MKKVLNVGGGSKDIPLPPLYAGWEHILLDIDPRGCPDIVGDARELTAQPPASYDSVYCSHNLEHYHRHDARRVLAGFAHVLKPSGFAYIRVPDLGALIRLVAARNLDLEDILYQSPAGPISVRDVIYGYGPEIERSGNDFFAHKSGYTQKSLTAFLRELGFSHVLTKLGHLELTALAFLQPPRDLGLKP